MNYRLQKEGRTLDGILLLFFYLLLHPLYGTLIEEGHQEFGAVVVEEFRARMYSSLDSRVMMRMGCPA